MSDSLSDPSSSSTAVIAKGGHPLLEELRRFLKGRGIHAEIVRPPGFTGKG